MIKTVIQKWISRSQAYEQQRLRLEIERVKKRNVISSIFGVLLAIMLYTADLDTRGVVQLLDSLPWLNMAMLCVGYVACLLMFKAVNVWVFWIKFFLVLIMFNLINTASMPVWLIPGKVSVPNIQMIVMAIDAIELIMIVWDLVLLLPILVYGVTPVVTKLRGLRRRVASEIVGRLFGILKNLD